MTNDVNKLKEGIVKDYFNYAENDLYELMHQQGKRRFGSECKHERIVKGRCTNCLRKVVDKK